MSGTTGSPQEKKPLDEMENWNLDRSVLPYTMVRGIMKKVAGVWSYWDGKISLTDSSGNDLDVNPIRTDIEGNGYVTIGTTEVALTFTGQTNCIHLESKITNTGTIWIGKTGVTNAGANSLASLQAGESIDIRYNDATNALYAISDTEGQSLLKGALL